MTAKEWLNRGRALNKTIEGLEKAKMRAYDIAVGTAAEHNAEPIDWTDDNKYKCCIVYDSNREKLCVNVSWISKHDTVYFDSGLTALDAIQAVGKDDVLWLYRDYQPYLSALKMEEQ